MSGLTLEKLDPQFEAEPTGLTLEKLGVSSDELGSSAPETISPGQEDEDMGLFVKGWHRGKEQLQATGYGALGLAGSGLGIESLKDYGYKGYLRNIKEAEKYPKEQQFLKIQSPLDAGKWAVETFGEVAPSMIEAGVTATVGAFAASAVAPGPGTVSGGVAGFFGKRAVKHMLNQAAKQYMKKGLTSELAKKSAHELVEKIGKSAIQKQAFRSMGAKAGIVIGISPVEAGGNWGEAMERGIDNPWSALATGTAAGFLELAGGNIRIIDKILGPKTAGMFAKAVKNRSPGVVSRIVREAAHQAPQEFLQESGQELLSIANIAYNDPTFEKYTRENLERLIEAGAAGGVVGLAGGISGIITPKTIQNTAEADLSDDKTYAQNRDAFVEQINKGFADGSVSIEDVMEAKAQHEESESPDPKVISAFNEIISTYEETTGPVEEAKAQEALVALESFKGVVDGLDARAALKAKDKFVNQYPWLEDQANEAVIDAQVYAGARKRVGILTTEEQAERDFEAYEPGMPGETEPIPAIPETRLRKAPPTYPEGAEYVAGKEAPEDLDVGYKPILTAEKKPWKRKDQAFMAMDSKRLKDKGITRATHKVVKVKGGFGIVALADKRSYEPSEGKLEKVKGKTLLSFVRAMGGIRDASLPGEVRALSGKETGVVGLTTSRTDKGLAFDEMASAAVEHGWLPENLEDQSGAFSELLRNDIFAQKEGKQRAEQLKDIAERTERKERWDEFDRAEDEELEYFAKHPDEVIGSDLDQWQRESVEEIRRQNDAKAAREIEESAESEGKAEAKKETPGLVGSEKDEGWTEFSEAWDENDALDEETLVELEEWRIIQEGEGVAVMAKAEVEKPKAEKEITQIGLVKRYVKETGEKVEKGELHKVKEKYPEEWAGIEKVETHKKELWDKLPENFRRNRGINEYTIEDLEKKVAEIKPSKEEKLKEVSKKVKTETPGMLKESDKVNDVTLGTLVKHATEDPAKALEHAADATVSKAKLIEGLKNKGLKAMGEAKSKEERAKIKGNLEETLLGIEEGKPKTEEPKIVSIPGGKAISKATTRPPTKSGGTNEQFLKTLDAVLDVAVSKGTRGKGINYHDLLEIRDFVRHVEEDLLTTVEPSSNKWNEIQSFLDKVKNYWPQQIRQRLDVPAKEKELGMGTPLFDKELKPMATPELTKAIKSWDKIVVARGITQKPEDVRTYYEEKSVDYTTDSGEKIYAPSVTAIFKNKIPGAEIDLIAEKVGAEGHTSGFVAKKAQHGDEAIKFHGITKEQFENRFFKEFEGKREVIAVEGKKPVAEALAKEPWEKTKEEYLTPKDSIITLLMPDGTKRLSDYSPFTDAMVAKGGKIIDTLPRGENIIQEYNIPKTKIKTQSIPIQKVKYGHDLQHEPSEKTLQEYTNERIDFSEDPIIITKDFHVLDGNGRLANRIYRGDKSTNVIILPFTNNQYKKAGQLSPDLNCALAYVVYKRGGYEKRVDFMDRVGQNLGNPDDALEMLRKKKWEGVEKILIREVGEHQQFIQQALKSGKLTPEKYTELHKKDYGPLAEFMPEVVGKPGPEVPAKAEKESVIGVFRTKQRDSFGEQKEVEVPVLSLSEPINVRGKVSAGNWAVKYETPSTLGKTGKQTNTEYFFKKVDAQNWIEEIGRTKKKEPLSETKSRLLANIKSEKGSSELINDLSRLGADAIRRGHKSFKAFTVEMKAVLGDAWAKVKHLMQRAYADAKLMLANERGLIGGVKAKGAPAGQLAKAQKLLAGGKDKNEVWRETGWMKGVEKEDTWKFEIDDSGAKFTTKNMWKSGPYATYKLSELLEHKKLYEAYPQIKDVNVDFKEIRYAAHYNDENNTISIGLDHWKLDKIQEIEETFLHELQHVIQEIEGFARGGRPEQFVTKHGILKPATRGQVAIFFGLEPSGKVYLKEGGAITKDKLGLVGSQQLFFREAPGSQYQRLAGEIEARDTSARAKLTAKQRKEQMPYESQGIPQDQWIVTEGKGTSFSVEVLSEGKKDLPAFMQDFLAKAKTEPAPEFGSAKATPPPIGSKADTEKVNSWLADNTDSAAKSIIHYLNMDLNILEQVMASPEYYQHPVMKKMVRFFTRTRPETYHHYFNHLNDTELSRDNDVVQQLKDLKGKGVFWGKRLIGSTSKEYKTFKEMTDTVDIEGEKDPKDSMEEHLNKVEKAWRARGATDDVIAAFRAQRGAYERGLALQRRQMEELLDKMVKKKASKVSKIAFGKKESTKRFGKQYLEKPDLFSSFRTVTYKTAEKWDLPSAKGINYVVGTYAKGGGQGVQSVNFDKNVFDETAATDWWNKNKEEISIPPGDTAQIRKLRKTLKQALASMGRLEGTYAPRQRDPGDYAVLASKKTASGKIRTYRNHKTNWFSADRLAKRLTREGWIVKPVEDVRKQPEDVYQNIKTISVANALDEAARTMSQRKDLNTDLAISFREDLIEQMANEIKARGFRGSMIHRKAEGVVEGYNDDPLERLLIWMNSLSSGLAKAHVSELATRAMLGEFKDGKRVGGIDSAAEKRVYSVATKYLTEQLRNTETSDRLIGLAKSITTFKYLGFNARSVTVNLTAMVTTVPAAVHQALNGKVSFAKIGKEIGSAGKDYAKFMAGKPFKNAKDQAFAEQVRKLGWDDPQYTREALSNLSNSHERIWTKMMDASMYVFGKAEQWNRGSTMLATYRLAIKQGHNETDAADMAKGASDSAHATYGKATYPIWAQDTNIFAKGSQLFYMYGKFGHNYVQLCYDLGMRKHNIKAFAWAALSPVVLAGGMVLPFKDEMFWFFGGILRALGIGRDPEKWWWDSVRRYLGDKGELVARHGITGLMGGDISGSLSIGVGVPRGLLDLVGAPGGVVEDVIQAGRFVGTQQYGRAGEKILPRGFENVARAIRERETGLVTQRGQRKWTVEDKAYQPSGVETGLRAAGFRSAKQAVLAEREWEAKKEEGVYSKRKSKIYEMYRAYLMRPKPDKHKEIRKLVNEFNANIKGKNVARITFESMKRQARRMRKPTKRQAGRLQ